LCLEDGVVDPNSSSRQTEVNYTMGYDIEMFEREMEKKSEKDE
jgi:hypothetical protein